jgi:hypothetical protein
MLMRIYENARGHGDSLHAVTRWSLTPWIIRRLKISYFLKAGYLMTKFSIINLRQRIAEMPTVDFDSEGEELIRRDDVLALLRDGADQIPLSDKSETYGEEVENATT